ncbi:unnamed protein product [Sphagnum troendelagicum]|uniref:Uncharacterized protein n=1 Tax=Sphagnum troendelagicum TaxID=128251 RepID=A0ABP0TT15_9BRYO
MTNREASVRVSEANARRIIDSDHGNDNGIIFCRNADEAGVRPPSFGAVHPEGHSHLLKSKSSSSCSNRSISVMAIEQGRPVQEQIVESYLKLNRFVVTRLIDLYANVGA